MQAFALIDQPSCVESLGILRIEFDCFVKIGPSLVELALNAQQIGAAEIGRCMIGISLDRAVKVE